MGHNKENRVQVGIVRVDEEVINNVEGHCKAWWKALQSRSG
jgi:hypothetical protein